MADVAEYELKWMTKCWIINTRLNWIYNNLASRPTDENLPVNYIHQRNANSHGLVLFHLHYGNNIRKNRHVHSSWRCFCRVLAMCYSGVTTKVSCKFGAIVFQTCFRARQHAPWLPMLSFHLMFITSVFLFRSFFLFGKNVMQTNWSPILQCWYMAQVRDVHGFSISLIHLIFSTTELRGGHTRLRNEGFSFGWTSTYCWRFLWGETRKHYASQAALNGCFTFGAVTINSWLQYKYVVNIGWKCLFIWRKQIYIYWNSGLNWKLCWTDRNICGCYMYPCVWTINFDNFLKKSLGKER